MVDVPGFDVQQLFDAWWAENYPGMPPSKTARAGHVAFGLHVANKLEAILTERFDEVSMGSIDLKDAVLAGADMVTNKARAAMAQRQKARAALAQQQQQQQPATVAPTNEELRDLAYQFTTGTGLGERFNEFGFARAVLERWGGQQQSAPVAGEGSLVEAVKAAINAEPFDTRMEACAAILAVADWLECKAGDLGSVQPEWWIAQMLRQEVEG